MTPTEVILRILKRYGEVKIDENNGMLRVEVPNSTVKYYLPKEEELTEIYEKLKLHSNVIVYEQDKKIAAKIWS